jgi:hypothetical protein
VFWTCAECYWHHTEQVLVSLYCGQMMYHVAWTDSTGLHTYCTYCLHTARHSPGKAERTLIIATRPRLQQCISYNDPETSPLQTTYSVNLKIASFETKCHSSNLTENHTKIQSFRLTTEKGVIIESASSVCTTCSRRQNTSQFSWSNASSQ